MSENREITEKTTTEEIEEIDIMNLVAAFWNGVKKLWGKTFFIPEFFHFIFI